MKAISIAGTVGKDAVMRRTQSGDAVLGWSVAVDDGYGENKTTLWFDCSLWGKRGDSLSSMLKKGTRVAVSGDLSTRVHEGKTYLMVNAQNVTLMSPKPTEQPKADGPDHSRSLEDELDDGIPF